MKESMEESIYGTKYRLGNTSLTMQDMMQADTEWSAVAFMCRLYVLPASRYTSNMTKTFLIDIRKTFLMKPIKSKLHCYLWRLLTLCQLELLVSALLTIRRAHDNCILDAVCISCHTLFALCSSSCRKPSLKYEQGLVKIFAIKATCDIVFPFGRACKV